MSIKEQLNNDVKEAMRSRDAETLTALRLITAAVKQVEVDERIIVDEARMLMILDKLVKQRKESISQFEAAGRQDLVKQEQFELTILNRYLPEPFSEAEVMSLVEKALQEVGTTNMSDMGKIMAILKPQLQGRADMAKVSAVVKAKLNA